MVGGVQVPDSTIKLHIQHLTGVGGEFLRVITSGNTYFKDKFQTKKLTLHQSYKNVMDELVLL